MSITIVQDLVTLRCGDNLVTFSWPPGADEVTVSQTEPKSSIVYSVQEAHDLFHLLLEAGAY